MIVSTAIARLARLSIAQHQLPLTATDGDQRIDHFQSGLQRHGHWSPLHNRRRVAFAWHATQCRELTSSIQRSTNRIDYAPQQFLTHRRIDDTAGTLHTRAGL